MFLFVAYFTERDALEVHPCSRNGRISFFFFFFLSLNDVPVCVCETERTGTGGGESFYPSPIDGHSGCIHGLAVVNSAAVNTRVHMSL